MHDLWLKHRRWAHVLRGGAPASLPTPGESGLTSSVSCFSGSRFLGTAITTMQVQLLACLQEPTRSGTAMIASPSLAARWRRTDPRFTHPGLHPELGELLHD